MKETKSILKLTKEVGNGSFETVTLAEELIEDIKELSSVRYYLHKKISECFDEWCFADFDDEDEVYYECDEDGEIIDNSIYYVLEKKMHDVVSSKEYKNIDLYGRCAKGDIELYTE